MTIPKSFRRVSPTYSDEELVIARIFLHAWRQKTNWELTFPTKAEAIKARLFMYAFRKKHFDNEAVYITATAHDWKLAAEREELFEAMRGLNIALVDVDRRWPRAEAGAGPGQRTLRFSRRTAQPWFQEMAKAVGLDPSTVDGLAARELEQRVLGSPEAHSQLLSPTETQQASNSTSPPSDALDYYLSSAGQGLGHLE